MKKLLLIAVILLPAIASATSLTGWMDVQTLGDSLKPQGGKMDVGGMLRNETWALSLYQRYSGDDSTGVVPRFVNSYSRTVVDFRIDAGPVTVNPDLCWLMDLGDEDPEVILPQQAGIARREGYIRPGLEIEADLGNNFHLFAEGLYWNRDLRQEDDYDLAWTESRIGGGVTWKTPLDASLTVAALNHNTRSDFIGYDRSWSRIDAVVSIEPHSLPQNMYVSGEVSYSAYDGMDFLDQDIADRVTSNVRLVQMGIVPSVSVNTEFESIFDIDDGTVRTACTALESRLIYRFRKDSEVPSAVVLSGKLTRSSVKTEKAGLFTRINIYRGFSVIFDAEARVTPTSVPGAEPHRERYVFGPGLEYQFGNTARIWGIVEQERTNLRSNENWWRIRSGLEFYPGSLQF